MSRKPFGTGLAAVLALSPASPIALAIGFGLLRAIIPGKRPVAPAREYFRGSLSQPSANSSCTPLTPLSAWAPTDTSGPP